MFIAITDSQPPSTHNSLSPNSPPASQDIDTEPIKSSSPPATWAKSKNTNISVLRICCGFSSFRYLSDIFQQQIVVFHAVFQQKWTFRKSNFPSRCVFNQYRCYSASIRRMRIFIYTQISEINKSECKMYHM